MRFAKSHDWGILLVRSQSRTPISPLSPILQFSGCASLLKTKGVALRKKTTGRYPSLRFIFVASSVSRVFIFVNAVSWRSSCGPALSKGNVAWMIASMSMIGGKKWR